MIGSSWSDMEAGACVATTSSAVPVGPHGIRRHSQRRSIFDVEGKKFCQILKSLSVSVRARLSPLFLVPLSHFRL